MLAPSQTGEKTVRTTLQLEDDVFIHAKQLAAAQGRPLVWWYRP